MMLALDRGTVRTLLPAVGIFRRKLMVMGGSGFDSAMRGESSGKSTEHHEHRAE
jgi:hypothetical protein